MKKIICKNCGGQFDSSLSKCPYCGTMNKKGAYADFRKKISGMIESMLGMKDEAQKSVSRMIVSSVLRGLILVLICMALGFTAGYFQNVNYYNDKEYDQKTYDNIVWEDENLEKLEEAYRNEDYDTIKKLYYENSSVIYNWEHYASYCLKEEFSELKEEPYFSKYILAKILYFLFYPDYYANTNKMSKEEYDEYLADREELLQMMKEKDYTEVELKEIYKEASDDYGYLDYGKIEEMMKEETDG